MRCYRNRRSRSTPIGLSRLKQDGMTTEGYVVKRHLAMIVILCAVGAQSLIPGAVHAAEPAVSSRARGGLAVVHLAAIRSAISAPSFSPATIAAVRADANWILRAQLAD